MKEWLKQNWFKLCILVLAIWVAIHLNNYLDQAVQYYDHNTGILPKF